MHKRKITIHKEFIPWGFRSQDPDILGAATAHRHQILYKLPDDSAFPTVSHTDAPFPGE